MKLQEKIVEWGEALLAPFVLFLYRAQIGALAREARGIAADQVGLARIRWHYSLPGRVRPLLFPVLMTVVLSWLAGSLVFWNMLVPEAGTITYWCWTVYSFILLAIVGREYWSLGRVRPISRADLEQLEADTANMNDADARALRERRFGPMRVLGVRAFGLVILGYFMVGVGLALMGSFSNLEGSPWPLTAQFILFAIIAAFASLFMAMLTAVVLGTTARVVGSIATALFKGGWDSIVTMLPNVEGEEAKELLPKDLDKQIEKTWKFFQDFMLSAPGQLLLGVFALAIVWHHPLIVSMLLLGFIGLMGTTAFSMGQGNDETAARKRAGKLVAWAFTAGFLYRCAEMWYFGLPGGTWYWNYRSVAAPLASLWNKIVPWWNGLTQMSWWQAGLVISIMGAAIWFVMKSPDSKWMQRIKYALISVCGAIIGVVVLGFIANRASVDASISPATASSEVTAETVAAPVRPVDTIDRMTRTTVSASAPVAAASSPTPSVDTGATASTPLIPRAVPRLVVTERVPPIPADALRSAPREASPAVTPDSRCEAVRMRPGLTDSFRQAQLRRLGC